MDQKHQSQSKQVVVASVQVKEQMMLLEAQLEKQTDNHMFSEEMEQVCNRSLLLITGRPKIPFLPEIPEKVSAAID